MRRFSTRKAITVGLLVSVALIGLLVLPEAASAAATVHTDLPATPGLGDLVGQLLALVSRLLTGLGGILPS